MELLIRTVDKYTGKDPHFQAKTTKRGDVISVCPDGWTWSQFERTNPEWVIVKVLDLLQIEADAMLTHEQGDDALNPYLKIRDFNFDLDALNDKGYNLDKQKDIVTIPLADIQSVKVKKTSVDNPFKL